MPGVVNDCNAGVMEGQGMIVGTGELLSGNILVQNGIQAGWKRKQDCACERTVDTYESNMNSNSQNETTVKIMSKMIRSWIH